MRAQQEKRAERWRERFSHIMHSVKWSMKSPPSVRLDDEHGGRPELQMHAVTPSSRQPSASAKAVM